MSIQLNSKKRGGRNTGYYWFYKMWAFISKILQTKFFIYRKKEKDILKRFADFFKNNKNVELLGGYEKKLNIFSFRILNCHYNLGVTLFNDLFGIQCRGGCSCAGSYAHELLNIPESRASEISKEIQNGNYENKPGWIRFNIHFIHFK